MYTKKRKKISFDFRILLFYFWFFFFLGIFSIFFIFYAASKGYLGTLPSTKDIENPTMEVGSEVYDSNGILLGKFFSENRTLITYKKLPKNLINALIAKEDIRFKYHSGIDAKSLLRAIFSLGKKGGGSTISQQLAKLLFTGPSAKNKLQRMHQKLLEWVMAIELEKRYTKEEIITMYYNKFDFLYNAKGIETAAHTYFNKTASELNLGECATLVGMLENPSLYNPKIYPYRAKKQRNLVLSQMKKYDLLNEYKYKEELKKPVKINFKMQKKDFELLTYYGEFLKKEIQEALNDHEKETGQKLNLYSSGLKIYTSIDEKMQDYAEKAVKKHLSKLQILFNSSQKKNKNAPFLNITPEKTNRIFLSAMRRTQLYQYLKQKGMTEEKIIKELKKPKPTKIFTWNGSQKVLMSPWDFIRYQKSIIQAGMLSIEPYTGYIKAWVGGIDFNYFQYDHVAKTKRQVGSVFKPILYAAAIKELHYNPCTKISNEKFHIGKWSPRNSNGKYGGHLTLKDGLALSVNTISARLIAQITPGPVIDLAKRMGVESMIPEHPSIALGSSDLTLYEMTGAFNTFTNYGNYVKPSILVRIEDKYGKIIKERIDISIRKVFSEEVAYIMLKLMEGVVQYGTAKRLHKYNFILENIAGKTGTTNENSDGWFIGMIPNLTTGVWVGWEDRFAHFENIKLGQGANMALPIWAYYMKSLYKDTSLVYHEKLFFHKPKNSKYNWDQCEENKNNNEENNFKDFLDFDESLNTENPLDYDK
ncbi:penicillin-binding protein [Blattabacterium sp. (Cryptocercus kyebangensis)]|uniref:transglycosylase domain-containing protein n=1 Tax=Blattabacterium sp. (Cryptocercus kyebangensis) TaxID=298656 RepID=UPI000D7C4A33|nr:transglycosylase domain-containing protein [Blattabacterium sp. (Cryptocercus kyebangensis)]AWU43714.1 penicillin-binding protein [Blattabacterium sp. (Cryptocercus kyebangensis)]